MGHLRVIFSLIVLGNLHIAFSQNNSIYDLLDDEDWGTMDSLSIFLMIDSLLNDPSIQFSTAFFSVNYTQESIQATSDNPLSRNSGFTPSISYFHKTGISLGISSNWMSDFNPKWNRINLGIGLTKNFMKGLSYSIEYERSLFPAKLDTTDTPFEQFDHSLGCGLFFNKRNFTASFSYSLWHGDGYLHRILPRINYEFHINDLPIVKKLTLNSSVSAIFGDDIIYIDNHSFDEEAYKILNTLTHRRLENEFPIWYDRLSTQQIESSRRFETVQSILEERLEYDPSISYSTLDQHFNALLFLPSISLQFYVKDVFTSISYSLSMPFEEKKTTRQGFIDPRLIDELGEDQFRASTIKQSTSSYFSISLSYPLILMSKATGQNEFQF